MKQKIYIFDVSNIFYRSFFGNERLAASDGTPTQALHGFIRTVHGIMRDNKPDYVAFAMEGGGKSLRKTIDPLYKANREAPVDDLKIQLNILPELMSLMSYPVFKYEGYEADDTIAALTKLSVQAGLDVVIVSSDKDFNQLVSPDVRMFNLTKNDFMGPMDVLAKYGIGPAKFLDYLAIVGDSSDNIKGVAGIGPKGAVDLLNEFGTLDGIYANLNKIKGAKKDKLIAAHSDAYLAKQLASFFPITLTIMPPCLYTGPSDKNALRTFFRRYEFRELENMIIGIETMDINGTVLGVRQ